MPQYREIAGFPGYRVGDDGQVWSCKRRGGPSITFVGGEWHLLAHYRTTHGYIQVTLSRGRRQNATRYVHLCAVTRPPVGVLA